MVAGRHTHEGEHGDDFGEEPVRLTFSALAVAAGASLNSCIFGYELATSTKVGNLVQQDLNITDDQRQYFVHCLELFAVLGAVGAWYLCENFGRRKTMLVVSIFTILGQLATCTALNLPHLLMGRAVAGLALGLGLVVTRLYITELAPAKHRGFLVAWSSMGITAGLILGANTSVVVHPLTDDTQWRVMMIVSTIMPFVVIAITLHVLPESPRWLIARDEIPAARAALRTIYGLDFDVDAIVTSIEDSLHRDGMLARQYGGHTGSEWILLLRPTPAVAGMRKVALLTGIAQQATGFNVLVYFIVDAVYESGLTSADVEDVFLVAIGFVSMGFIYWGATWMDLYGRRKVLIGSSIACGFTLWMFAFTYMGRRSPSTWTKFIMILIYFACYSVGLGPATTVVSSEVWTNSLRPKGVALTTSLTMLVSLACRIVFSQILATEYGWESVFFLYGFVGIGYASFFFFNLRETKGICLEDMLLHFAATAGDARIGEVEAIVSEQRCELDRQAAKDVGPRAEDNVII